MSDDFDWRHAPDGHAFPSQRAAERALGLPTGTVAHWRKAGLLPEPAQPITVGWLRPALRRYRPHHRAPALAFRADEVELIVAALTLYGIVLAEVGRHETKPRVRARVDALIGRLRKTGAANEQSA